MYGDAAYARCDACTYCVVCDRKTCPELSGTRCDDCGATRCSECETCVCMPVKGCGRIDDHDRHVWTRGASIWWGTVAPERTYQCLGTPLIEGGARA